MNAMDNYKRRSGRMFPTCSEVLEVILDLGYVKQDTLPTSVVPTISAPIALETAGQSTESEVAIR